MITTTMARSSFFLNSPLSAVDDNLEGLSLSNANLQLIKDSRILLRKDLAKVHNDGLVTLICGGGSGHEPSHGGFVGRGMLTAAVAGDIFASPPVTHILEGLSKIYSPAGTIVIVKNYTGDRLNFGMAIEQFRVIQKNAKVEIVLVDDDVATSGSSIGGRGICGTVLMYKILGALAEDGHSFEEILHWASKVTQDTATNVAPDTASKVTPGIPSEVTRDTASGATRDTSSKVTLDTASGVTRDTSSKVTLDTASGVTRDMAAKVTRDMASLGVSLAHCSMPGKDADPSAKEITSSENSYEIGLGIHNEPGVEKLPLEPASVVVNRMLEHINGRLGNITDRPVIVTINNLGGLSVLEMNVLTKETLLWLRDHRVTVAAVLLGTYMTSLNMPGFSITLLKSSDEIEKFIRSDTDCVAWPKVSSMNLDPFSQGNISKYSTDWNESAGLSSSSESDKDFDFVSKTQADLFRTVLLAVCETLNESERFLNTLDSVAGDGDCGSTLKLLADAITKTASSLDYQNPKRLFWQLSQTAAKVGGTSGALYGVLFSSFSNALKSPTEPGMWSYALEEALEKFMKYSHAKPGQKSMLDSLVALDGALRQLRGNEDLLKVLQSASNSVKEAAENTQHMTAQVGRASYSKDRGDVQSVADPGAMAVGIWVDGIYKNVSRGQPT